MAQAKDKEVRRIKASTELQQKVGTGTIDEGKVAQAQQLMDGNKVDFEPLARPQLDLLEKAIAGARKGSGDQKQLLESICQPIMNLKANAATFNYPVISDMAGTVLTLLEHVGKVDDEIVTILDNLRKAVMVIVLQKMSGKDSKAGAVLAKEFRDVCKRYVDKRLDS